MIKGLQLLMILMFSFVFSQEVRIQAQIDKPQREISKDSIYTMTEQGAEFPGGLDRFRQEFSNNFDISVIKGKGLFSCELTFVILENGQIINVEAKGNDRSFNAEAIRALNSMKNKVWKPGKINGEPVKSRYKIPFKINFE